MEIIKFDIRRIINKRMSDRILLLKRAKFDLKEIFLNNLKVYCKVRVW